LVGYATSPYKLRLSSGNTSAIISAGDAYDVNKGIVINHTTGNVGIGKGGAVTKLDINGEITTTGGNSVNWSTAYGWGNHGDAGYLTSFTETDPSIPEGSTPGEMLYWNGSEWVIVAATENDGATLQMISGLPTWVGGTTPPVDVTNPLTGEVWMDRNLGASQVATSSTDYLAYGDLYQWGRASDGHQTIVWTSSTTSNGEEQLYETTVLSTTDTPGHGYFITNSSSPYDWRSPQNHNLWQGVSGTNNPCPSGYRIPTEAEWEAERLSWNTNDVAGAFASPLKLPVAGKRLNGNGSLLHAGFDGNYWSSTVDGPYSWYLDFYSSNAYMSSGDRVLGTTVRCIKD